MIKEEGRRDSLTPKTHPAVDMKNPIRLPNFNSNSAALSKDVSEDVLCGTSLFSITVKT